MRIAIIVIVTLVNEIVANHYRQIVFSKMNMSDCRAMTRMSSCPSHHEHKNNFSCALHVVRVTVVITPVIITTVEVITTIVNVLLVVTLLHHLQAHSGPHVVPRRVRVTRTTPSLLVCQHL